MTEHEPLHRGFLPVPDPTVLTTQQWQREIATSREIVEGRISGLEKVSAITQATVDGLPGQIAKEVRHLRELHEEKFQSIKTQFAERDTRTEQTSRDSKVAVDAALQAAKEAVNAQQIANAQAIAKSEAATTKQMDQTGTMVSAMEKSMDGKIGDLKDRLMALEAYKKGTADYAGWVIGIIGVVALIATVVVEAMKR